MAFFIALGALSLLITVFATVRSLRVFAGRTGLSHVARFFGQSVRGMIRVLPAREHAWGTVYDSETKRPVPFAKVRLLDEQRRVLETRIADHDGRYGFLISPESLLAKKVRMLLIVDAPGYRFPSQHVSSLDQFLYHNPYRGGLVPIDYTTLIRFDIPMDPVRSQKTLRILRSPSVIVGVSIAVLADIAFWVGSVAVPLGFIILPNPFTFGTLCLFLGAASLRISGIRERPFGLIFDAQSGRPMPYALIRLTDTAGRRIAFAVSDEYGRYVLVVPRGRFELSVVTPASVQPSRHFSQTIGIRHGWVTMEVRV